MEKNNAKKETQTAKEKTTKKTNTNKTTTNKTNSKKTNTAKAQKTATKEKEAKKVVKQETKVLEPEIEEDLTTEKEMELSYDIPSKKGLKTSDIVLILGLVVVVILGFLVMKGEKVEPSYDLPLTLSGEAGLSELTYAEYQEKIDNKESFVLIIERASCSHCENFMPVAESFAKEKGLPMYYVDTDTFSEEDWSSFETSNTFLKQKKGNWGTPTTIVLAGNEAVDYIEGETTAEKLSDLYNNYFNLEKE